jgi:hypothetical protein
MMMLKDMDQAAKMLNMRIKIDVWSQGLAENRRVEIREHLRDLFCQLPTRRVWLYLKRIRFMHMTGKKSIGMIESQLDSDNLMNGPEDVIANGKYPSPDEPALLSHH